MSLAKPISLSLLLGLASAQASYQWSSVQVWGGGYVPGVAFHPLSKSLAYLRTDVGGAYRMNADKSSWTPLTDVFTNGADMGSIALGLDEADTNYVYLTGGIDLSVAWAGGGSFMRSADRGATWTKTSLTSTNVTGTNSAKLTSKGEICLGGNATGRGMGNRIAAKGTTIYLGTNQNGLLKSTDRGTTWATVKTFGDTAGIGAVQFDAAGNIYAAPYSGGLYKSSDGSSWTQLSGFTGTVYQMSYSKSTNTLWLTTNTSSPLDQNNAGGGSVWTFDATAKTFAKVTMPAKGGKDYGYLGVSVNPNNAKEVAISTGGWWKGNAGPSSSSFVPHEALFLTRDGGSTWTDILAKGSFDAASAYSSATSNPHWLSALAIDPADPDHVVFGTGYGIWSTFNASATTPKWTFTDNGVEETVPLALVSSTYGAPLVSAVGDVDGYYHTNLSVPPSTRHQIEAGTNFDLSYAGQAPNKMIRIFKEATKGLGAYSNDGGKTWTAFKSYPPFVAVQGSTTYTNESNFAAISADGKSIVWNMQKNGVYYSTDSGANWTASKTSASLLTTADGGFHVIADRVTAGTFYIYNGGTGKLYSSTDNGANWTAANTSLQYDDSWAYGYFRVFASPKQAGELWFTQGIHASGSWIGKVGSDNIVYRSTNGGKTVSKVSGLASATYIGFGKGNTDAIPAIYVVGTNASSVNGIFRSVDDGATWTQVDDAAHKYGGASIVIGDPCIFSRIYITGSARGILYAEDGTNKNSCTDRIDGGSTTSITSHSASALASQTFYRAGSQLVSDAPIQLYGLNGRLLRQSQLNGSTSSLSLEGMNQGVFLAKSGAQVLKVNVQ